jgi:hypothetical protein
VRCLCLPAWLFNIKLFQNERKLDLLKDKRYNNTARCLAGDILSKSRCKKSSLPLGDTQAYSVNCNGIIILMFTLFAINFAHIFYSDQQETCLN